MSRFRMKPACMFHPLTTVFLDDQEVFLQAMRLGLGRKEKMFTFSNPEEAIKKVNASFSKIEQEIFKPYNDLDNDNPEIKLIDLNIGNIRNAIYNRERFNAVGVLVVDFKMPHITGTEVCKKIINKSVYKVMLTAEAGLETAVIAFNEETIDKFLVKKDSDDFFDYLHDVLCGLREKFFQAISQTILNNLDPALTNTLKTPVFIELFNNVFYEANAVEYYLLDASGSYLFLDKNGYPTWLIVRNNDDFKRQLDMLSGFSVSSSMKENLQDRKKLLFLLDESEYHDSIENWSSCLFDANKLTDSLWYTVTKGPIKKSIRWRDIQPYQDSK